MIRVTNNLILYCLKIFVGYADTTMSSLASTANFEGLSLNFMGVFTYPIATF